MNDLPHTGGLKYDAGKPPLSLIDRHAIEDIARVLGFGAKKYAAHNWRNGVAYSRLIDAALRHLYAFADGEDNDPESGLSHVAHAGCCIIFLLGLQHSMPAMDDRHKQTDNSSQSADESCLQCKHAQESRNAHSSKPSGSSRWGAP